MSKKIHLKLDTIDNNQVLDLSGNDFHGTVVSGVSLVEDDLFGTCMEFNGTNGVIELPSSEEVGLTNNSFSVSAWVCPYASGSYRAVFANNGPIIQNNGLLLTCHQGKPHIGFVNNGTVGSTALSNNEWYYLTWIYDKDAREQILYVNGDNKFVGSNKNAYVGTSDLKLGNWNQYFFNGKVYGLRVYDEVLSQADILYCMREDQGWPDVRATYPIDFDLHDEDHQNVLYITETSDQLVTLNIENASTNTIQLADLTAAPASSLNYHFALRFRPGTLSATSLDTTGTAAMQLNADSSSDWQMAGPETDASGMDVIYLKSLSADLSMAPESIQSILFENVGADGGQGSRGTRVELLTQNMAYSDALSEELTTSRELHLNVINQRGQKDIPMHVGFVGDNGVLNNGDANDSNGLTLRISNSLNYDGVHSESAALKFIADADATLRSEFKLVFETGNSAEEWALGTAANVAAMNVSQELPGWYVEPSTDSSNPEWTIYPTSDQTLYSNNDSAGDSYFDLELSNLVTSFPTGHAYAKISYRNIPGYWDGQIKVALEKRPLVYGNYDPANNIDYSHNVGIGTNAPTTPLAIKALSGAYNVGISQNHGNRGESTTMELTTADLSNTQASRILIRGNNDNADIEFHRGAAGSEEINMIIEGTEGKVGIGTETPSTLLELHAQETSVGNGLRGPGMTFSTQKGDGAIWPLGNIYGVVGNPSDGAEFPGGLAFYTKSNDGFFSATTERMRLDYQGHLGIGVDAPATPISILKDGCKHPVGITQMHALGGGNASMEFTTADQSGNQATRILLRGDTDEADIEFRSGAHGSEAVNMFIKGTNGNVGIGTVNPRAKLHVVGNMQTDGTMSIKNDSAHFVVPDFGPGVGQHANTVLAAYFDGLGNGPQLRFTGAATGKFIDIGNDPNGSFVVETNDVRRFYVHHTGVVEVPYSLIVAGRPVIGFSDERLKSDVAPISSALDKVLRLEGVSYRWNDLGINQMFGEPATEISPEEQAMRDGEKEKLQIGLMAQAVEAVVPEVVNESAQGYKTVSYQNMVALLVEAIKEQNETIQDLSNRLDAMS